MEGLGENISKWRRRKGMTQSELAEKIGVQTSTLGSYEINRREPPLKTLIAIADALHMSVDALLNRDMLYRPSRDLTAELLHAPEYQINEPDNNQLQFLIRALEEAGYQITDKGDDLVEIQTPSISASFNRKDLIIQNPRIFLIRKSSIPVCVVLGLQFGAARLADHIILLRETQTVSTRSKADD